LDFERGLHRSADLSLTSIQPQDFPLPHFGERLERIVAVLESGSGLALLRGLPVFSRFSQEQATRIYWAIGKHMGELVPQNRRGDLIGDIRDLGAAGPFQRIYATNEGLAFHTDSTDFVGLLCLRPALHGGESSVVSSAHLYNLILSEHPEYLPILYKQFPTDWRSEEPPGSPGWYLEPFYSNVDDTLSGTLRTYRVLTATRFSDVPRLSAEEMSCLLYLESLPKRRGVALSMELDVGDIQLLNNFVTLHTRSAFVDDPHDPAKQRHLLRLWISRLDGGRPLCPEYANWRLGYASP
jgi:Taurine catabolism dioxygenase TauD, TfdA family